MPGLTLTLPSAAASGSRMDAASFALVNGLVC
jgi:hypothetical protein